MTLVQGAGVHSRSLSTVTYSRPEAAKPPSPLKNSSGGTLRTASNEGVFLVGEPRPRRPAAAARGASQACDLRAERTLAVAQNDARGSLQQIPGPRRQRLAAQREHPAARARPRPRDPEISWRIPRARARAPPPRRAPRSRITRSTASRLRRQYCRARRSCLTSSTPPSASRCTSTIGKSPDMPHAQRSGGPDSFRGENRLRRAQRAVGVEHVAGYTLKSARLIRVDLELRELRACLARGGGRDALERPRVAVLGGGGERRERGLPATPVQKSTCAPCRRAQCASAAAARTPDRARSPQYRTTAAHRGSIRPCAHRPRGRGSARGRSRIAARRPPRPRARRCGTSRAAPRRSRDGDAWRAACRPRRRRTPSARTFWRRRGARSPPAGSASTTSA